MKKTLIHFLIIIALVAGIFYLHSEKKNSKVTTTFNCALGSESDFDCYRNYYTSLVKNEGVAPSFVDLKERYEKSSYVSSQCHQITHVIGYEASKKFSAVADAYTEGDSFCWSGYYHGVLEGVASRIGLENLGREINGICKPLAESDPYSFNHYNCVHGLGHGIMAIKDDELFQSLEVCNKLDHGWDKESCWSGAFMENVMADSRYHKAKYLKPEDPLYPCNSVDEQYKNTCYLMQTSYMLTVLDNSFEKVFEMCGKAEENYHNTCYQSLGRDASGRSISDIAQTKAWCNLGKTVAARENCIIGAVKDFISYLHSDVRAKELCLALDEKQIRDTCYATAVSYYQIM